jgi:hypothetical protein
MLLDWERFREILEFNSKHVNDNHAQLLNVIGHGEFLLEFLTKLLQVEIEPSFRTMSALSHVQLFNRNSKKRVQSLNVLKNIQKQPPC